MAELDAVLGLTDSVVRLAEMVQDLQLRVRSLEVLNGVRSPGADQIVRQEMARQRQLKGLAQEG
jgi:hypothetical protein